ncbi:DUF47 domain-containing protein [Azospirillum thermophilum]|uniref:DUF47 domain-containing protein n=1 Tax=Azospirillum thermophilum TaxID=2202148 RepID=A0A2S2CZD3_9PROT|nr:DUF47 family protein [Azospirillum thermophilum]AWK89866.1 DUF47 domain-containing protein [Azospirillum thermophilum]
MLLRAFRSLMPKEERFVDHFLAQARHIADAAKALDAVMQADPEERPARIAALKRVEKDADRVAKEAGRGLHRAFITPFDRSDILALINALDDAIDLMDEVPRHAALYGIESFDEPMHRFVVLIGQQAELLVELMPLLGAIARNAERIGQLCGRISDIEDEADNILREALQSLIKERPEMIAFLGRREVYEMLEAVTDRCDDVGDLVEGITLDQV